MDTRHFLLLSKSQDSRRGAGYVQEENGRREVSGAERSSKEAGQGGEMLSRLGQIVTKIGICKKKPICGEVILPKNV